MRIAVLDKKTLRVLQQTKAAFCATTQDIGQRNYLNYAMKIKYEGLWIRLKLGPYKLDKFIMVFEVVVVVNFISGLLNNIKNKENNSKPEKEHSDKTIYVKKCTLRKQLVNDLNWKELAKQANWKEFAKQEKSLLNKQTLFNVDIGA